MHTVAAQNTLSTTDTVPVVATIPHSRPSSHNETADQSNSNSSIDTTNMPLDLPMKTASVTNLTVSSHQIMPNPFGDTTAIASTSQVGVTIQDLLAAASNAQLNKSTDVPQNLSIAEFEECDENAGENAGENVGADETVRKADYELEAVFYTEEEWKQFLKLENWSTRSTQKLKKGIKITHRCNQTKSTGPQCSAGGYTLQKFEWCPKEPEFPDEMHDVDEAREQAIEEREPEVEEREVWKFYRKLVDHDHIGSENQTKRLSKDLTNQIIELFLLGKTPMAICYKLRDDLEKLPMANQPTYRQVYNAIESYKRQTFSEGRITMRQLEEFVNQHNEFPNDEDEDSGFVVAFSRSQSNEQNQWFRMFISTRRLLRRAAGIKIIHADATHKTTTEKLPLLVVGSTDMGQKFHFIGLAITTDETSQSYEFVFQSVAYGVQKVTGTILDPDVLVADGDMSIRNGFHQVFGAEKKKTIMCFPHVMGNVQRKYYRAIKF